MHVRLGAFDMIVEIVTEKLDVRYSGISYVRLGEMAREEHYTRVSKSCIRFKLNEALTEGDVSQVVTGSQTRHLSQLQWGISAGI